MGVWLHHLVVPRRRVFVTGISRHILSNKDILHWSLWNEGFTLENTCRNLFTFKFPFSSISSEFTSRFSASEGGVSTPESWLMLIPRAWSQGWSWSLGSLDIFCQIKILGAFKIWSWKSLKTIKQSEDETLEGTDNFDLNSKTKRDLEMIGSSLGIN